MLCDYLRMSCFVKIKKRFDAVYIPKSVSSVEMQHSISHWLSCLPNRAFTISFFSGLRSEMLFFALVADSDEPNPGP